MTSSSSSIVSAVVVALAAVTAGCGGSSGHSTTQSSASRGSSSSANSAPSLSGGAPADQRAVLAAVNGYYAALQAHQGPQACDRLTPAAQRNIVAQISAHSSHFGHTCKQILGGVGLLLSGQVHVVSGSVTANAATLTIQGKSPGTLTLSKTSGRWLISSTS